MTINNFIEHKYFNTYYYANIVNNILSRDINLIGFISNFFVDDGILYLVKPFQKFSAFHEFIKHMVWDFFFEDMYEYDKKVFEYYDKNESSIETLYAEYALNEYNVAGYSFKEGLENPESITFTDIEDYHNMLMETGCLEEVFDKIANEVFYIMFNNREALLSFNYITAEYVNEIDLEMIDEDDVDEEIINLFTKKGVLKRVEIPEWCKRAVYFRDRGKCCFCGCDLSGTLSTISKKHYDHIVPLAEGGLNDISNIQLLCSTCNQKKSNVQISTSNLYESWY